MELNFKEIKVKTSFKSDNTVVLDIRESFANILYQRVPGIASLSLAKKIYDSDGPIEFNENELKAIKTCAENFCIPAIIEALNLH